MFFLCVLSVFIKIEAFPDSLISSFEFKCLRLKQNFTVPDLAKFMLVDITGAAGGTKSTGGNGKGARIKSKFSVIPGQLYYVFVGCKGGVPDGGYNGGGSGIDGGGGGGGSDIRSSSDSINDRIIVAAGGGGSGSLFDYACDISTGGGTCKLILVFLII